MSKKIVCVEKMRQLHTEKEQSHRYRKQTVT